MPPFDTTLAFFRASLVLAMAPGPDNVFVLLHAASHGRRADMLVVLGLCSGLLVHTAAVALSDARTFRRGVLMNVSNPKVAIFFVALALRLALG